MTSPSILATFSALLVLGAATACTITNKTDAAPASDGGTSATPDGGAPSSSASAALTCLEIFQCAAACTGSGCEDTCLANGSDDGKVAATNVAQCYQSNSCADANCLKTKCSTELGACGAQANTGGAPVGMVPAASAAPAGLVGMWHRFYQPNVATTDWTFNADGTATLHDASSYDLPGGCKWAGITDSTGTITVQGDMLTFYQTAGTQSSSSCGQEKTEPAPHNAYTYQWSIDASGKLTLGDRNTPHCIDNPTLTSCTKTFDRQ